MPTKKTRFTATLDGEPRELFSVVERNNKDIQLILKSRRHTGFIPNFVDGFGRTSSKISQLNVIREKHISVHRLLRSATGGIKLSHNVETHTDKVRFSTIVEGFNANSVYPVLIRNCGNMEDESFDHNLRQGDRVFNLGEIGGQQYSPVFFLLVAGRGPSQINFTWPPATCATAEFTHFRLHAGCYRVKLPGLNFSKTLTTISASPTINGENTRDMEMRSHQPMTPLEALNFLESQHATLMKEVIKTTLERNLPNYLHQINDSILSSFPRMAMIGNKADGRPIDI